MQDDRFFRRATSFLLDIRTIQTVAQVLFVVVVVVVFYRLVGDMLGQLAAKNISPTFDFLKDRAGFQLADAGSYTPDNTYAQAFQVGVINTLRVVVSGLALTTILGILGGIFLLSGNWLVRTITRMLVEIIRNTPLLVQLFIWYYVVLLALPQIRDSVQIPPEGITVIPLRWLVYLLAIPILSRVIGRIDDESLWKMLTPIIAVLAAVLFEIFHVLQIPLLRLELTPIAFLSNRGLALPALLPGEGFPLWLAFAVAGLVLGAIVHIALARLRDRTGRRTPRLLIALLVWLAVMAVGWIVAGSAPLLLDLPQRAGLRYTGGASLLPPFAALVLGLVVYTASFIAEIVRAGIQAVPHGQVEAARALGLSASDALRLIVLPQALRVIIPPLGNQYLNLAKNSSLAIAISFTDVFQVTGTIINQTGQSVSGILLVMACYLILSLTIATGMNLLNRRFQLVTR